jgi:hypothetical protein
VGGEGYRCTTCCRQKARYLPRRWSGTEGSVALGGLGGGRAGGEGRGVGKGGGRGGGKGQDISKLLKLTCTSPDFSKKCPCCLSHQHVRSTTCQRLGWECIPSSSESSAQLKRRFINQRTLPVLDVGVSCSTAELLLCLLRTMTGPHQAWQQGCQSPPALTTSNSTTPTPSRQARYGPKPGSGPESSTHTHTQLHQPAHTAPCSM